MYKKLYLASKSPRRQELLKLMCLDFELLLNDADESFPKNLEPDKVPEYIAEKKAKGVIIPDDAILITADTVVLLDREILGKPIDEKDAVAMLKKLSGEKHQVITGVCIKSNVKQITFKEVTEVFFKELTEEQIEYYVEQYKPLDKAGSYGIQEWIGLIGIEKINGSYTNVVGLPTEKLYTLLSEF